jgi:hypothetical protein
MWVFRHIYKDGPYEIGYYSPDGIWHHPIDCKTQSEAMEKVHYLNGGK